MVPLLQHTHRLGWTPVVVRDQRRHHLLFCPVFIVCAVLFLLHCSSSAAKKLRYSFHCPLWGNDITYRINYINCHCTLSLCYSIPFISVQRKSNTNGGVGTQSIMLSFFFQTKSSSNHKYIFFWLDFHFRHGMNK